MTFCSCVMVGPSFAPPVVRSTRLRLAPLTTGNDAHHFVNSVRSSPNFHTSSLWSVRPHLTQTCSCSDVTTSLQRLAAEYCAPILNKLREVLEPPELRNNSAS